MRVTKSWLQSHKTNAGSWTKAQADILGLDFPLRKGWQQRIIGKEISETDRMRFELSANTNYSSLKKITGMYNRLNRSEKESFYLWLTATRLED